MKIARPFTLGEITDINDAAKLTQTLNTTIAILREIHNALTGQISLGDNIKGYNRTIDVLPPYGQVPLPWSFSNPPSSVMVASIQLVSGTPITNPIQPLWHYDTNTGFIMITKWLGIPNNQNKYKITLNVT